MSNNKILWQPKQTRVEQSAMYKFMEHCALKFNFGKAEYSNFHLWSVTYPDLFWAEFAEFSRLIVHEKPITIIDNPKKMPGANWFEGAKLNYAENLLSRNDDAVALYFRGEASVSKQLTFRELRESVRRASEAIRNKGILPGDRIAAVMPNMPETVVLMLAAASVGAVWSSVSPDFGTRGILDRFQQIEPKLILVADGYFYKGKPIDIQLKINEIQSELPTVSAVILVTYIGTADCSLIKNSILWDDFVCDTHEALCFEHVPFSHPLFILYSSGTTGLPKSIVHTAGGTLIQHLKEHLLHSDIKHNDIVFYYTTCGWMMWNWLVSALATGASLVLFDGNPFYPSPDALLKLAHELDVTFFGTSAKYISALESENIIPNTISDYKFLRTIASTGSPLSAESFDFVYDKWKSDVQLASISGGTDIISCFVLGNPILPVRRGEIQCKGLGMDVACFDFRGKQVINEQGELVCRTAFPSMPSGFWNDAGGLKYQKAYFEEFAGVWHHGDFCSETKSGGFVIHGRSDATLNPQGVRIGTAEIYNVLANLSELDDCVVVGKRNEQDEQVVLFVKLTDNVKLSPELEQNIRKTISVGCSPRHVPAIIRAVPDIPYTLNGKKVELAVKKIIHGQTVGNREALVNPESLDAFIGLV